MLLGTAELLYQSALDYFADEDYSAAEAAFMELIENHSQSPFAIAAMHELMALRQFTDYDFTTLRNYFETFSPADSMLYDVAQFLATRCNVKNRQWQPAVDWYENRIGNPPSYQDSVFAVIDLGEIHLMMEEENSNDGGPSFAHGNRPQFICRFPEIKPASKPVYAATRANLLATLPKVNKSQTQQQPMVESNSKGALRQNKPNPATESTTIVYELFTEGVVEIRIYNLLGQPVQTIQQGTLRHGVYQVEVSLTDVLSGIYQYVLFVEGERSDAKKMVVGR